MTLRWRLRKRAVIVGLAVAALLAGADRPGRRAAPAVAGRRSQRADPGGGRAAGQPAGGPRRHLLHARGPGPRSRRSCSRPASGRPSTRSSRRPSTWRRAGFAVLAWSPRGTGASGGQIALNSPDYEIKDTEQLVSWLARQPRVLLDHPGDPRVGIAGASYGGGLALLAAAYDHRIDAVVAQSAWNNLATALFPNAAGGGPATGVFKKQWAGLLFTQGSVGFGTPLPGQGSPSGGSTSSGGQAGALANRVLCGRFLPSICAMYQQIAQTGQATPGAISLLLRSSPASVAGPDGRPGAADPGRARLAVRSRPGQRELPGDPPQRGTGGHGLVRGRPRRRRPGDQPGELAHGGVVPAAGWPPGTRRRAPPPASPGSR